MRGQDYHGQPCPERLAIQNVLSGLGMAMSFVISHVDATYLYDVSWHVKHNPRNFIAFCGPSDFMLDTTNPPRYMISMTLKQYLAKTRLTLRQLEQLSGVSNSRLSQLANSGTPSLATARAIEKATGGKVAARDWPVAS